jgi:hypothetical protein
VLHSLDSPLFLSISLLLLLLLSLIQVSKTCKGLSSLLLDGIGMTDYGLQNVVQQCTKLQTLRFRYGDGVTDSSLLAIAQYCTGLKSLTLDFWNKFNQLSVSDNAIKKLLCACTQLVELSLCNCMILTGTLSTPARPPARPPHTILLHRPSTRKHNPPFPLLAMAAEVSVSRNQVRASRRTATFPRSRCSI